MANSEEIKIQISELASEMAERLVEILRSGETEDKQFSEVEKLKEKYVSEGLTDIQAWEKAGMEIYE